MLAPLPSAWLELSHPNDDSALDDERRYNLTTSSWESYRPAIPGLLHPKLHCGVHYSESNSTPCIPQSCFLSIISINPMHDIQHSVNAVFPPFFARADSLPCKVFVIKSHLGCNLVELCQSESVKLTEFFQGLVGVCVVTRCVTASRDLRLIFFQHFKCEALMWHRSPINAQISVTRKSAVKAVSPAEENYRDNNYIHWWKNSQSGVKINPMKNSVITCQIKYSDKLSPGFTR